MKHSHHLLPLILACTLLSPNAHAVTCATFSSPGWAVVYDPMAALAATTTSSVTVTCTRQTGDPKSLTLTVAANNGLQPAGTINQAALLPPGSLVQYDNYTDAAHTLVWGTGGSTLSIPLAFGPGQGATATATVAYYASIPAGQTAAAAGTYSDTVAMTLNNGATVVATATFNTTVTVNPVCTISTPPGSLVFNYTSFQAATATASTSFAARCTNALPYTLSLDATAASLLGLNYTLAVPAGTYTGTGLPQAYTINGSIAAGQAGTCATAACTGTASHTLTITY